MSWKQKPINAVAITLGCCKASYFQTFERGWCLWNTNNTISTNNKEIIPKLRPQTFHEQLNFLNDYCYVSKPVHLKTKTYACSVFCSKYFRLHHVASSLSKNLYGMSTMKEFLCIFVYWLFFWPCMIQRILTKIHHLNLYLESVLTTI